MNEQIKQFFDNVADSYEHKDSPRIDELLDSLNLSNRSRILDLGAGKGIISNRLQNINNGEVVALDISPKMSEYAHNNCHNPNIKVVTGDFYCYSDEPFDAIICFDAYPHFMDVEAFVKKSYELLKENGLLIVLHDIGRITLNEHHRRSAGTVSRKLKDPINESSPFLNYFNPLVLEESDIHYKMVFTKK